MSSTRGVTNGPGDVGPAVESETFRKMYPDEYVYKFLRKDTRPDGRTMGRFRRTTVTIGAISTAHGSSLVRTGGTTVVCGIKAEIAEPTFDAPGSGFLVPNVELSPMCSPRFKPGPPSDEQQVLSDRINAFLKDSQSIDLSKLCIEHGKAVWVLYVDVQCLNYDGNVMDAVLAAATTALMNVRLPEARLNQDTEIVEAATERTTPLILRRRVFSATIAVMEGGYYLVDPSGAEEQVAATSITVACDEDGVLCGTWKPGGAPVSPENLRKCIEVARRRHATWMFLVRDAGVSVKINV